MRALVLVLGIEEALVLTAGVTAAAAKTGMPAAGERTGVTVIEDLPAALAAATGTGTRAGILWLWL